MSYKIFKNLPYARRGYIFKNKTIQNYYESLEWYRENPNYVPKWSDLTKEENEWRTKLRKQSLELLKNLPFAKRGYVFKKAYLQNYFKQQCWYEPNKNYKVLMSELTAHEKKWLQEVKKLKVTDNFDLYEWIDKYNQNYDNCLHKHEKKKVEQFLGNFVKYEKYKYKKQIIERLGAKFFKNGKVESFEIYQGILEELGDLEKYLKKYSAKENREEEIYKTFFRKDKTKEGCYEYILEHDVYIDGYSEGDYNTWIGIGKEKSQFKFVYLDMAG